MVSLRLYFLGLFLMFTFFYSALLRAGTIEDGRVWLTYTLQHPINEMWKVTLQAQPYWRDEGHAYDQVTYRPGVYYRFNQAWSLGAGYAYALGHPQSGNSTHEHRLWEDVIRNFSFDDSTQLSVRTRLEHRHTEHQEGALHGLREYIRWSTPLNGTYQFVVADECYLNLNDGQNTDVGFDQNRLFFGVAAKIDSSFVVEVGYMNQYAKRSVPDVENHILSLSVNQTF